MTQTVLNEDDKRILGYIQEGHNIMSELFDLTGWNGERVNFSIEKLDENRFIERDKFHGAGFWSFTITERGNAALPPLGADASNLALLGLCPRDLEMLRICKKAGKSRASALVAGIQAEVSAQIDYAGSVVKLIRRGYLKESGFLKRIIVISPEGERLLS